MKTATSLLLWSALALAAPAPTPHTFAVSSAGGNLSSPWQYGIMFGTWILPLPPLSIC